MELSDLRIFCTVIREGGVTRAAHVLHRVQSNVTTRIQQLEAGLGVPLFVREGRGMRPTAAGEVLHDYAERLLRLADEACAAVAADTPYGRLRLGAMESTAAARLPARLAEFHAAYPAVRLELRTGPTGRLVADVLSGQLDCALVSAPVDEPHLTATPIYDEELVLIAAAGHTPIRRPADVGQRSLLAFEAGCAYRRRLEDWLASGGGLPERVLEMSSYHAMIGCVAAGMGIALVPLSLLPLVGGDAALSTHRLAPEFARAVTLFIRRRGQHQAAVDALAAVLV